MLLSIFRGFASELAPHNSSMGRPSMIRMLGPLKPQCGPKDPSRKMPSSDGPSSRKKPFNASNW
jgi:hypothetical protein